MTKNNEQMHSKNLSVELDKSHSTATSLIIDGEKENCKILFDCFHVDELKAFKMIKDGIKITPENTPVSDFELRLVSSEESPYGFMSICKRKRNTDEWEYNGLGHSGAASIVTALLKELSRKEQECEQQKAELELFKTSNQTTIDQLKAENEELKETIQLQNKMQMEVCKEKNKELDQLKRENEELKQFLSKEPLAIQALQSVYSDYRKRSEVFFEMIGEYKQTLSEIKEIAEEYSDCHAVYKIILQKINEVKDEKRND